MNGNRFSRFEKIVGSSNVLELSHKTVLIVGCGGVGGYVAEGLARSGIGTLVLVDFDVVDESNINRQIIALTSTIGRKKVDVLEERILDINPNCRVFKVDKFINSNNISLLFQYDFDYLVDACDSLEAKKSIILECIHRNKKFISSMGTGNKLDPSKLEILDIRKTVNDPLARILRKFVKDEGIKEKIMVLSSLEVPIKTHERTPGSSAFVPSSAGLLIASYIVREFIIKKKDLFD